MSDVTRKVALAVLGPIVAAAMGSCGVALNSWHTVGKLETQMAQLEKENAELKEEVKELRVEDKKLWEEATDLWKSADTLAREIPD